MGCQGLVPYGTIAVMMIMAIASAPIWFAGPAMAHFATHDSQGHGVFAFIRIVPTVTFAAFTFAAFTFGALEQGTLTLMPIYGLLPMPLS